MANNPSDETPTMTADVEHEQNDQIIGQAFRWSIVAFALCAVIVLAVVILNRKPQPAPAIEQEVGLPALRESVPVELPTIPFTDVTRSAGTIFVHENGALGEKLLPETMGGGCAFLDVDNDGDQDLILVNSKHWATADNAQAVPDRLVLYLNDGRGSYHDATEEWGLNVTVYGMGAAVGDYDNDGNVDLFVSALGRNVLLKNDGRRFVDVTEESRTGGADDAWSTSCGWFDFDNDGDLDLFVCNYLAWNREFDLSQDFRLIDGERAYGRPQAFPGTYSYLYQNDGEGRFREISESAGLRIFQPTTGEALGKSLGVTFRDVNRDGWMDIIVANDTVPNFLFLNQGDRTFLESGVVSGIAFDSHGNARGGMGIDVAHLRNDEGMAITIGNFANEMTALYVSERPDAQFIDEAIASGLGPQTRLSLTFGVAFFDADNDGRLDLLAANGHLEEDIERVQKSQTYAQSPQLFWNCGSASPTEFVPLTDKQCGPDLFQPIVGRGLAYADIDLDGDLDVLITAVGHSPRLLRNDLASGHHWLQLKLIGRRSNRDAIGAEIEVTAAGITSTRQVMPTRSYISQVELPVTFGLGTADRVERVAIRWPSGITQQLDNLTVDTRHVITEPDE